MFSSLWEEVLASGVPLCFHNGLVDLAFIYHHFYAPLPQLADEFLANISDWFICDIETEEDQSSEGVQRPLLFDSKYIAEFGSRWPASFLEYIFK